MTDWVGKSTASAEFSCGTEQKTPGALLQAATCYRPGSKELLFFCGCCFRMPFRPHSLWGIIFLNNLRTTGTILNAKEQNKDIANGYFAWDLSFSQFRCRLCYLGDHPFINLPWKSATFTMPKLSSVCIELEIANKTKWNIACLTTHSPPRVKPPIYHCQG